MYAVGLLRRSKSSVITLSPFAQICVDAPTIKLEKLSELSTTPANVYVLFRVADQYGTPYANISGVRDLRVREDGKSVEGHTTLQFVPRGQHWFTTSSEIRPWLDCALQTVPSLASCISC